MHVVDPPGPLRRVAERPDWPTLADESATPLDQVELLFELVPPEPRTPAEASNERRRAGPEQAR